MQSCLPPEAGFRPVSGPGADPEVFRVCCFDPEIAPRRILALRAALSSAVYWRILRRGLFCAFVTWFGGAQSLPCRFFPPCSFPGDFFGALREENISGEEVRTYRAARFNGFSDLSRRANRNDAKGSFSGLPFERAFSAKLPVRGFLPETIGRYHKVHLRMS